MSDMKKLLALFESQSLTGTEAEVDGVRIVIPETRSTYYSFSGTKEEAEQFVAQLNAGEVDLDDERLQYAGESDHTDYGDAWVA